MKLVVGCPTRNRTWILPKWKEYIDQGIPSDIDYEFVFVVGEDDSKTIDLLSKWDNVTLVKTVEKEIGDLRSWADKTRYEHMAYIRNLLLNKVREIAPDIYVSIDSDILLNKDTFESVFETFEQTDASAVGSLAYLDKVDKTITNAGMWIDPMRCKGFRRVKPGGSYNVDILMALKFMRPSAYNVDYSFHSLGEDLGWSRDIRANGLQLAFNGTVGNKHVMSPEWLEREDKRIGW
jgi:hypothetical protein